MREANTMTHGSLFSGIGGFELGAERAGIPTLWNCEIEERKRKILRRHFPQTIQEDCGNAVIPTITEYLFEAIKLFDKQ